MASRRLRTTSASAHTITARAIVNRLSSSDAVTKFSEHTASRPASPINDTRGGRASVNAHKATIAGIGMTACGTRRW